MNKILVNSQLNRIKDKYPGEIALIEGIQNMFNGDVRGISDEEEQALLQFPMQFTQHIPTGDRSEWTTKLHQWADQGEEVLLAIDPLVLTARDSKDETVLMSLLLSAMGRFTQQVDYDLLQKILDTNMNYVALELPGDESTKVEGSAWNEKDLRGFTALDYLADFAMGTGVFDGTEPDLQVQEMLAEFSKEPEEEPEDNTDEAADFDEEAAQQDVIETNSEIEQSTETDPDNIPDIEDAGEDGAKQTEKLNEPSSDTENKPSAEPAEGNNDMDAKKKELLNALLTIGKNLF